MIPSSHSTFDALYAVSQRLEEDFIDQDMSEIEIGNRQVTNTTVTLRGRHHGRAVVLQYADYYSEVISPLAAPSYEHGLLEFFVAQPRVTFEGTCGARSGWDKFLRFFGGGGLKGDSAVFESCRVEATGQGNVACLQHQPFAAVLEQMAQQPACRRVKMQAGAGVVPILSWYGFGGHPDAIMAWLDQAVHLAATLD